MELETQTPFGGWVKETILDGYRGTGYFRWNGPNYFGQPGVDILTFGQYLRPTPNHLPVERYVTPEEFAAYREEGLEKGFTEVVSGPMVRSSYRAEQALQKNNVGIAI